MLQAFIDFIEEKDLLAPGDSALLAISGGLDSVVMTDLFHRTGISFAVAHCNFKLRGKESDADESFVKMLAEGYGAEYYVRHFDTEEYASEHGMSIQMAARELRYQWLEQVRKSGGFAKTATAHHLDDAIETFFINIIRGTGISGLTGINVRHGQVIRPLMFADRKAISRYAGKHGLQYREDSSNLQLKYLRNKIRHQLIPGLMNLNPSINKEISDLMSRLQEVETIYIRSIEEKRRKIVRKKNGQFIISKKQLLGLEPVKSYLFGFLTVFKFNKSQVDDIINALPEQPGKIFHSPTHELLIDRDELIITAREDIMTEESVYEIHEDYSCIKTPVRLEFRRLGPETASINPDPGIAYIDLDKLTFPLRIRKWEKGDYFYPLGMKGRKKMSDFFIDEKVPLSEKRKTWLLCSGNDVVWVIGRRLDNRYKVKARTKTIYRVELIRDVRNGNRP